MLDHALVPQVWIYCLDQGTEIVLYRGYRAIESPGKATGGSTCECRGSREVG